MRLSGLRRHWNEYGRSDPLWAILTDPDKKGTRWSIDEVLQTGRDEIAALVAYLDARGLCGTRRRALDFGCGAGRLSHALAAYFERVIGVDIAPSMIDAARKLHASVRGLEKDPVVHRRLRRDGREAGCGASPHLPAGRSVAYSRCG